jgi:hypothetical protein
MVTSSSTSGPTFDILAPSRSNGDILQHIRAHVPPSNAVCGEDNGGRPGKRGARGDPREGIMVSFPAFDETRQSRIMENGKARILAA